jgi:hypothetical protein
MKQRVLELRSYADSLLFKLVASNINRSTSCQQ